MENILMGLHFNVLRRQNFLMLLKMQVMGDDKDNDDCFGLVQRHLYGAVA